jgi:hypothetical protein
MKDLRRGRIEHSIHVLAANQAPSGAFLAKERRGTGNILVTLSGAPTITFR